MRLLCPTCGRDYTPQDAYCIECGERLDGIPYDEDYNDDCNIADDELNARNESR